jgi:branched-chain amino acid transport system substrate-binding protein
MSAQSKSLESVIIPILGVIGSVIIMLLARLFLLFIVRPVFAFFKELTTNFSWQNILNITKITSIWWLDIIIAIVAFIVICIIGAGFQEIDREAGISGLPLQIFWYIVLASFWCLGAGSAPLCYVIGIPAVDLLICPFVMVLCFLNTILDYGNLISNLSSGISQSIYIDVFTDTSIKFIKNVAYVNDFTDWMRQDGVTINNFLDYWWYSLRASVLGFRFDGFWQWLIAFPVNIIASITYFVLSFIFTFKGLREEINRRGISQTTNPVVYPLAFLMSAILAFIGFWWITAGSQVKLAVSPFSVGRVQPAINQKNQSQSLSLGERSLIPGNANTQKKAGIAAFAKGDFATAVTQLELYIKANRNAPEALIYLNNARIGNSKSHTIAVAAPIGQGGQSLDTANEIMRGVAQAQDEVNKAGGIQNIPLKVMIANDGNDSKIATEIADALAKNLSVLGVVGHFSSDATIAAGEVYQKNQLLAISPTSTSVKISGLGNYIFRTVPSDKLAGQSIANYTTGQLRLQRIAVFFNSASNYSKSLKNELTDALNQNGVKVTEHFDFASSTFKANDNVKQAISQGAEVIILLPDAASLDKALQVARVNQNQLPLLGGDSPYQIKTLEIGKQDVEGMVLAVPWHREADPQAEFTKNADRLWGADVNWRTAMAYDATKALIAALQQNPTRSGVQKALSATNFSVQGASGVVKFLPTGDRNAPIQLVKIIRDENSRSGTGYDFVPVQ